MHTDRVAIVSKHIFTSVASCRCVAFSAATLLVTALGCAGPADVDVGDDPQAQVVVGGGRSVGTVDRSGDGTPSTPPVTPPVTQPVEPTQPPARTGSGASTRASLGRQLFFDTSLSEPAGLACGTCHQERSTFVDPRGGPTSQGSLPGRVGPRNTPTILYASLVPALQHIDDQPVGGLFLDGRVNTLEEQAAAPFTNPIEMGNASVAAVMAKVRRAAYAADFAAVFGSGTLADDQRGFRAVTQAIATFERDGAFARFTSRFDAFLAGRGQLTPAELNGFALFQGDAKCATCHPSSVLPTQDVPAPMFTEFDYHNIGVPKNPDNAFYAIGARFNPDGRGFIDHGLAGTIPEERNEGKFRTPTLRNIARTAPYGHNGFFGTLREIVSFYNSRDVGNWPPPEIDANIPRGLTGNLGLSDAEIDDIVAFLETLSDQ